MVCRCRHKCGEPLACIHNNLTIINNKDFHSDVSMLIKKSHPTNNQLRGWRQKAVCRYGRQNKARAEEKKWESFCRFRTFPLHSYRETSSPIRGWPSLPWWWECRRKWTVSGSKSDASQVIQLSSWSLYWSSYKKNGSPLHNCLIGDAYIWLWRK